MKRLARETGFTLIEMALVTSILAIVVPAIFVIGTRLTAAQSAVAAALDASQSMRDVSEEIRGDLATLHAVGGDGAVLLLEGACGRVEYRLEDQRLIRDGGSNCGGRRAIAAHVASFARAGTIVEIHFATTAGPAPFFRLGLPEGSK